MGSEYLCTRTLGIFVHTMPPHPAWDLDTGHLGLQAQSGTHPLGQFWAAYDTSTFLEVSAVLKIYPYIRVAYGLMTFVGARDGPLQQQGP